MNDEVTNSRPNHSRKLDQITKSSYHFDPLSGPPWFLPSSVLLVTAENSWSLGKFYYGTLYNVDPNNVQSQCVRSSFRGFKIPSPYSAAAFRVTRRRGMSGPGAGAVAPREHLTHSDNWFCDMNDGRFLAYGLPLLPPPLPHLL